nr:NifU family protein [Candidatus Sigynarchaeota archaeon]
MAQSKTTKTGAKSPVKKESEDPIIQKIKAGLEQVSQYLQVDGGDIQFVGYDASKGEVSVRLRGHCAGCMHAQATLKNLVEQSLKEMLGEDKIKSVVNVV